MPVTFKVAETNEEFTSAHELMVAEGFSPQPLDYPTVLAYDGDELIGMLTTDVSNDMVLAGPLAMKGGIRRIKTAVNLAEFYESTLRSIGVTRFVFWAMQNSTVAQAVLRFTPDQPPYAIQDGKMFFVRDLSYGIER